MAEARYGVLGRGSWPHHTSYGDWGSSVSSPMGSGAKLRPLWVRLKVEIHEIREIHEIQFSEATNYRNPPALDREPRFLNVVANTWLGTRWPLAYTLSI